MKRFRSYFKEQATLPMRMTFGLLHCIIVCAAALAVALHTAQRRRHERCTADAGS